MGITWIIIIIIIIVVVVVIFISIINIVNFVIIIIIPSTIIKNFKFHCVDEILVLEKKTQLTCDRLRKAWK